MKSHAFTVIPYGRMWAVLSPEGEARCVVKSEVFAKSIAKDCAADRLSAEKATACYSSKCRAVRCRETGKIYCSISEAATETGVCFTSIRYDMDHPYARAFRNRPTFEEVL